LNRLEALGLATGIVGPEAVDGKPVDSIVFGR
jgi:hypothetical protein